MRKSIILILVLIGLIGVGSFYLAFRGDGEDNKEDLTGESVQDETMEEETPEEPEEEEEESNVINLEVGEGDTVEF